MRLFLLHFYITSHSGKSHQEPLNLKTKSKREEKKETRCEQETQKKTKGAYVSRTVYFHEPEGRVEPSYREDMSKTESCPPTGDLCDIMKSKHMEMYLSMAKKNLKNSLLKRTRREISLESTTRYEGGDDTNICCWGGASHTNRAARKQSGSCQENSLGQVLASCHNVA